MTEEMIQQYWMFLVPAAASIGLILGLLCLRFKVTNAAEPLVVCLFAGVACFLAFAIGLVIGELVNDYRFTFGGIYAGIFLVGVITGAFASFLWHAWLVTERKVSALWQRLRNKKEELTPSSAAGQIAQAAA